MLCVISSTASQTLTLQDKTAPVIAATSDFNYRLSRYPVFAVATATDCDPNVLLLLQM
jgi:hypothetical protein